MTPQLVFATFIGLVLKINKYYPSNTKLIDKKNSVAAAAGTLTN